MRRLLLFVALACMPLATWAQGYVQKIYVFAVHGELADGNAAEECQDGIRWLERNTGMRDINPNYFSKFKMSVVRTASNGKVLDTSVNEIGTILSCQDYQTYFLEKNIVPVYHEITLGKRKFRAVGAGTNPLFPQLDILPGGVQWMTPENYPEQGMTFLAGSATVLPALHGRKGGSLVMTNFGFIDGVPRDYYEHSTIGVLNVILPDS